MNARSLLAPLSLAILITLAVVVAEVGPAAAADAPSAKTRRGKTVAGRNDKKTTATSKRQPAGDEAASSAQSADAPVEDAAGEPAELESATFGMGCFWCGEAVFQQLKGVRSVTSGYTGGVVKDPSYEQVCSGLTGHAEVVQIDFDPNVISFDELLEVFWQTHDPTTPNRQGADIGTQYRSAIFYQNDKQKELAEHYKSELEAEHAFRKPIVTEITELSAFYPAEEYHQNYYNTHRKDGYCSAIIRPKIAKVKKVFHDKLKDAPKNQKRGS